LKAFLYAFRGLALLLRDELHFRIQLLLGFVAAILAGLLKFTATEWAILVLTIAQVLLVEALNAVIERVVDLISPGRHPLARNIKDMSAAAVLVSAGFSLLVGLALFGPKLWQLWSH
jgi:diacylglycerol kinase